MATVQEPRRKVVVAPSVSGASEFAPTKVVPIGLASVAIHLVLLGLAYVVFSLIGLTTAAETVDTTIKETTEVADESTEPPELTNTDIGIDSSMQKNFDVDRIEDVTVPGPVNATETVGIDQAPPDVAPSTISPPPGAGNGSGAPLKMADDGTASAFGSMGGNPFGSAMTGAFAGRSGSTRQKLLADQGGNTRSEAAVAKGLKWLSMHQGANGGWSLNEFNHDGHDEHAKPGPGGRIFRCKCRDTGRTHNDIAATSFALLPFLAAGQTHKVPAGKQMIDYSKTVNGGLVFLMNHQGSDGFYGGDMYSHGLAAITMCEAYGLTSDPKLKISAQKAINYIMTSQAADGGWRYKPKQAGDTSVTGWQLMALKSAQMAGLSVRKDVLTKSERFLDIVESGKQKGGYAYLPGQAPTEVMTAVALLCRQYQGIGPRNPGLQKGVNDFLKTHLPSQTRNMYYLYYATQVMHHMQGESWKLWNEGKDAKNGGIRDILISTQDLGSKDPHQRGSWAPDPAGSGHAHDGGRIMSTSLSLLCLEVYYRHLPLYRRDLSLKKDK